MSETKKKRYKVSIIQHRPGEIPSWATIWEDEAHTKLGARIKMSRVYKIIDNKYNIASQLWDTRHPGFPNDMVFIDTKGWPV